MRYLYHYWFCPSSRKIRIALLEKEMTFEGVIELPWQRRPEFGLINPAMTVPTLVEEDGTAICGVYPITEYLEDLEGTISLIGKIPKERAEVRRLSDWFDLKFAEEVTELLVNEKIMKRFLKRGVPEAAAIRCASQNIKHHLAYIEYLTDRRNWLAGDYFSYADISAAAQLSIVDYLGNVPWEEFPDAKAWYARIKSRPSVQALLKDSIPGLAPSKHYKNLDF